MDNATLLNMLLSLGDREIRLFGKWLIAKANIPPGSFLRGRLAERLLGPITAWVETLGEGKRPAIKIFFEKMSDVLDAAVHELYGEGNIPHAHVHTAWATDFGKPTLLLLPGESGANTRPPRSWNTLFGEIQKGLGMFVASINRSLAKAAPTMEDIADYLENLPGVTPLKRRPAR